MDVSVLAASSGVTLAAEGGYQAFELGGGEKLALLFSALTALLAIGVGFSLMKGVLAADRGTPAMIENASAIQAGASAYLSRQFRTIAAIVVPLAVVVGLVLAQVVSRLTEYDTSTETSPVRDIAEAARTGPATTVLSGIASGLESTVFAIIAIALALGAAIGLGGGNIEFTFYLVALTGMGMLATTGVVVAEDTFGPVSDNAAGIAEMSGEFSGEPERIMVSLDAVGNTTKAVTKAFAIGSAVIASVALFASTQAV